MLGAEMTPTERAEKICSLLNYRVSEHSLADKSNFAAVVKEISEAERDRLKLLLAEQEMHVLERGKEIDRLKAECSDKLLAIEVLGDERDLWKSNALKAQNSLVEWQEKADKLAEALRYTEDKIGVIIDASSMSKWIRIVEEALAEIDSMNRSVAEGDAEKGV